MVKPRLLLLAVSVAAAACVPARQPERTQKAVEAAPVSAPAAALPGERLVQAKCSTCHSMEQAVAGVRSEADWASVLDQMIGHGMEASAEELSAMRTYLAGRRPNE